MNQAEADLGIPALLLTGHDVKCTPGIFDEATCRLAMHGLRTRAARPAAQQPAPDGSPFTPHRPAVPRKKPERPRHHAGAAQHTARLPEKPVAPRTPPSISNRLKPRLATALFRRYLRACIPTGPDHTSPLTGARPEGVLTESQRVGQRHHH